ncbi:hypothetical protein AAF712_010843 [Marasmius tenuissimus]|uniref:Uncharacterized protein n=1 Tax=Marasmius tenuissimus TaxID=585030 RepID=A0ABR2ZMW4_9AGAR
MFGFNFPSWGSKTLEQDDLEAANTSSQPQRQPSTTRKRLRVDTSLISAPIPHNTPNSLTGFDVDDTRTHWPPQSSPVSATSSRAGPSNIAWLRRSQSDSYEAEEEEVEEVVQKLPVLHVPPPAVVRLEDSIHPLTRSVSSPASHTTYSSSPNPSPGPSRWNYMNPASAGSTHSLRLDTQHHRPMLSHGSNFSYPLMKPLSPIVEQDYISPLPFKTISLPSVSTANTPTDSTPQSATAPAPSLAGSRSTSSDRPSPAPFISRPVKRSLSASSSSSVQAAVSISPPIAFFPALSAFATSPMEGVQIRPKKSCPLPTITAAGSSEEDDDGASFVTASDSTPTPGSRPLSFNEQRFSRRSVGTVTGACTPTSIPETSIPPLSYEEQRYSRRSPVSPNTADPRTSLPQVPAIAVPPPVVFTETEVSMIRSDDADADMASPAPHPQPPTPSCTDAGIAMPT